MIIQSDFKPAWWLTNPHFQSMWSTFMRYNYQLPLRTERVELPDRDFIDINWVEPKVEDLSKTPIVLILHGLGGSIRSHYGPGLLRAVLQQNWRGVFMHFRGASGIPNRLPCCYHAGETGDVSYITNWILEKEPTAKIAVVGYSLGGNILLKWLGETNDQNPIVTGVAISVPFLLEVAANHMLKGFSQIYQWWVLRQVRIDILNKFKSIKSPFKLSDIHKWKTFWDFDNNITAPLHGFKDANDYYEKTSSRKYLKSIAKPTLIIHAKDDPFMTPEAIPEEHELSESTLLELSDHGGHVGFIAGNNPGIPQFWLEERIISHLKNFFPAEEQTSTVDTNIITPSSLPTNFFKKIGSIKRLTEKNSTQ